MTGETAELEIVAKGIFCSSFHPDDIANGNVAKKWIEWPEERRKALRQAAAAMLSIREPTPGMVKASNKTANSHAADKWRAIIDYVLGDSP